MIIAHWPVPAEVRQHDIANVAIWVPSCGPRCGGPADKTALRTGNAGYWWKIVERAGTLLNSGAECTYDVAMFPRYWEQAILNIVKKKSAVHRCVVESSCSMSVQLKQCSTTYSQFRAACRYGLRNVQHSTLSNNCAACRFLKTPEHLDRTRG